jgi:hypothetical protein
MKTAAIVLAALGLAVAGSAASSAWASDHLTDVDYLKANRCRGLAAGLGAGDTASLDALIKIEGRSRQEIIYQRGLAEQNRAKREATGTDGKERLTTELNGSCVAYMGAGSSAREAAASSR